jgi:hypothetical protein
MACSSEVAAAFRGIEMTNGARDARDST